MTMWHLSTAHKGRARGIRVEALAHKVNVSQRDIRQAVSDLRDAGVAIAALPSTGYYLAQTEGDIEGCCQYLRKRSMHSLRLKSRLRKMALPELLGQLSLDVDEPPSSAARKPNHRIY